MDKIIQPIDFLKKNLNDIECFEKYYELYKTIEEEKFDAKDYSIGDDVFLEKGTLLHGIKSFNVEKIKRIKKNGFLFGEYFGKEVAQQKYCVCFWVMNDKTSIKEYVNKYSSETIHLQNRITKKYKQIYIPFNYDVRDRQKMFKSINNFIYSINFVRDSKENQFLPSLNKTDDYIGFILRNSFTDKIKEYDIYDGNLSTNELSVFLPEWVINKTIKKKIPTQTDHEIAVLYGLPSNIIEGIIVGRLVESNKDSLKSIKTIFPNCYICNIDGKVIL